MKKTLLAVLLALTTNTVAAEDGVLDGIWEVSDGVGYYSFHQNRDEVIGILLSGDRQVGWEALKGYYNGGDSLQVRTIISNVNAGYVVKLTSQTTFEATQDYCEPIADCLLPNGYKVYGTKIW